MGEKRIGRMLSNTASRLPKLESNNGMYSLSCKYGSKYFGEISRLFEVRLTEQNKNVKEGKTNISKMKRIQSYGIKRFARWESNCTKRKIIEAYLMALSDYCLSQPVRRSLGFG